MLHKNFLVTAVVMMMTQLAIASPVIPIPTQPQPVISPTAPDLNVKSYVLMDADSGKILAEKNMDQKLAPASLTKLMTMYVISKAIKNNSIHMEDKVRVSQKAWQTGGSRMFIKVNDEVPVRQLLEGIVIASGNDAAVAMSEFLAGTEDTFAQMMNQEAREIGMTNSHFMDSNGLPNPNHYTTAHDLALLTQAIIKQFPEDYKLYSEKYFTYNNIRQPNRNRLLWRFPAADGLKTGHTDDAGYCLVGSAKKDNTRYISVIMGAGSDNQRTEDSIRLLTYGFRFYETHKFYSGQTPLTTVRVWKGKKKEIALGIASDLQLTIPSGQFKNIQANIQVDDPLKAPIEKGKQYGTLNMMLNNQVLETVPLIALSDDPKGGVFRSISDAFSYSFHKLFSKTDEKMNNG